MGSNISSPSSKPKKAFSNPYSGNVEPPESSKFITSHFSTPKFTRIGSMPVQNGPEFCYSPGSSLSSVLSPLSITAYSSQTALSFNNDPGNIDAEVDDSKLNYVPFYAVWGIRLPQSLSPEPRVGHFFCSSTTMNKTFIGFGKINSSYLGTKEIWEFNHITEVWTKIKLETNGKSINKREESCSTFDEERKVIYVFGGRQGNKYFKDLISITLNEDEPVVDITPNSTPNRNIKRRRRKTNNFYSENVAAVNEVGQIKLGLAGAFICYYNNNVYIWGGNDGQNDNNVLFIFELETRKWKQPIVLNVPGRSNAAYACHNGKMYIYGNQPKEMASITIIDFEKKTAFLAPTFGLEPMSECPYGRMLYIQNRLLYYGGRANNKFSFLYVLDLNRMWWFVFYIKPDNDTVTIDNGKINDNGLFLIPRIHSYACCYMAAKRTIAAFMGYPIHEPPCLFTLYLGDAFAIINLRDDMLDMMKFCQEKAHLMVDNETVPIIDF